LTPVITPVVALKVHASDGFPAAVIVTTPPDGAVAVIAAELAPTATAELADALNTGVLSVLTVGAATVCVVEAADATLSPTKFVAATFTT
jgi:hypothetical protein